MFGRFKVNSSIRLPLSTATLVSSWWRASISMRIVIYKSPCAPRRGNPCGFGPGRVARCLCGMAADRGARPGSVSDDMGFAGTPVLPAASCVCGKDLARHGFARPAGQPPRPQPRRSRVLASIKALIIPASTCSSGQGPGIPSRDGCQRRRSMMTDRPAGGCAAGNCLAPVWNHGKAAARHGLLPRAAARPTERGCPIAYTESGVSTNRRCAAP